MVIVTNGGYKASVAVGRVTTKEVTHKMSNTELVSKDEALKMMSAFLRKRGQKADVFRRGLMMYGKFSGWDVTNLRKVVRTQREMKG